jgi:hypothetical protein
MAIYRMLQGMPFDPDQIKGMTIAYEIVLSELSLTDRTDPLTIYIATKIIEHFRETDECDPERLCEMVLKDIRR